MRPTDADLEAVLDFVDRLVGGLPLALAYTGCRRDDGIPLPAATALQRETDGHLQTPVDPARTELYTGRKRSP